MTPRIGQPDILETEYTAKFKTLLARRGLFLDYHKDLASFDLGLHLFAPNHAAGPETLSLVKVWFQLKGKNREALPSERLATMTSVPVAGLDVDTVRFWLASPEAVYLVVYLEATGEFIAEEIRAIVARQTPEAVALPHLLGGENRTITLHVRRGAVLDQAVIERMLSHRTLRLDGPSWRGRPLGHNVDPLRSEIEQMHPDAYRRLVDRLLDAHGYRRKDTIDTVKIFPAGAGETAMTTGVMTYTYEWTHPLFTEFGYGPDETFRIESAPMYAQGLCAVLIDARTENAGMNSEALMAISERLHREANIRQLLVFVNRTHQARDFGNFRVSAGPLGCIPQDLGSLTFNLLTATSIYLELREEIGWRIVNYL